MSELDINALMYSENLPFGTQMKYIKKWTSVFCFCLPPYLFLNNRIAKSSVLCIYSFTSICHYVIKQKLKTYLLMLNLEGYLFMCSNWVPRHQTKFVCKVCTLAESCTINSFFFSYQNDILIHYSHHSVEIFSRQNTAASVSLGICLAGSNGRE